MSRFRYYLPFIEAVILIILLNLSAISAFFSQDDFFHLSQMLGKKLPDLPYMISPFTKLDYFFYRPFSREIYNFFAFNLFHLNPLPYHLVVLALIFINGLLAFKLINRLVDQTAAFIFLTLFSVSAVHNVELYYLSSIQTLISSCFMLLSINCFLNKKNAYSFIFFFLAVISHESALILPIILGIIYIRQSKYSRLSMLARMFFLELSPFLFLGLLRIFLTKIMPVLPKEAVYQPVLSIKTMFNTFTWYSFWSLGVSEMLPDFIGPKLQINPFFLSFYRNYTIELVLSLLVLISVIVVAVYLNRRNIFKDKWVAIFPCFFIVSLLPFLFFPQHKFIYYLTFPIIWFLASISILLSRIYFIKFGRVLVCIFIFGYLFICSQTIWLNASTYWAAKRDNAARVFLTNLKQTYPTVNTNATFVIINDPNYPFISAQWGNSVKQAKLLLSGPDGIDLLYNNRNIRVYYQGIDIFDKTKLNGKIYTVSATFPY